MQLEMFLDQVADSNMRIFMGMPKATDLQVTNLRLPTNNGSNAPDAPKVEPVKKVNAKPAPASGANEAKPQLLIEEDDEELGN